MNPERAHSRNFGAVLAALGNHEGKALTYIAMDPDVEYGISAMHRLFLEIQGDKPVFRGTVALPQKYCIWSFEPADLARRVTNDRGHIRHVKADPSGGATALAGHLLAATETYRASLNQIFGKTAAQDTPGTDVERPPARRLTVMRAVLDQPGPSYQADLARRTGIRELTVGTIAEALARAGLLAYRTAPTYEMKSLYEISAPIAVGGRGNVALQKEVVAYLNARLADHDGQQLTVARDEIEIHLRGLPRWQTAAQLRDQLQGVMVRLSEQKLIVPVRAFAGQTQHTVIDLDHTQRAFIEHLVEGVDKIATGDRKALVQGQRHAEQIVNDPARVCALLSKGFASSKQVTNPVAQAEKHRRVLGQLPHKDGITSERLTALLSPDLNKQSVSHTLTELASEGLVRGEKQPDGPYKLWYLARPQEE